MIFDFSFEEIKDILMNLDKCKSEGYINPGDPAYSAMEKLEKVSVYINGNDTSHLSLDDLIDKIQKDFRNGDDESTTLA